VAAWASDPLPPWWPSSTSFLALSQAPPELARNTSIRAGRDRPGQVSRQRGGPSPKPTAIGAEQVGCLGQLVAAGDIGRRRHDEIAQLRTALTQGQQVTSFGDKPLIVVTAGKDAQAGWLPLQDKMAQLSSNRVHRILPDVSHASLIEDHHDSGYASSAIIDVVHAVRSGAPLNP
jgi:hypothetical protein